MKDKVFMSYHHRRIWVRTGCSDIVYMVAKGDGTDEYFLDWRDAMKWIDERSKNNDKTQQASRKS